MFSQSKLIETLRILFICLLPILTTSLLPTSQIVLSVPSEPILSSIGLMNPQIYPTSPLPILPTPASDPSLCGTDDIDPSHLPSSDFIYLVPRGSCSFQTKVLRAESLGASGVVIHNNAQAMFERNETSFPISRTDYECGNGEVSVESSQLTLPYYNRSNDAMFAPCSEDSKCTSGRCVLAGEPTEGGMAKACCM